MAASKTYIRKEPNIPFVIRVLWFFLIGWHVTLYWIVAAWLMNVTIIGLPLGLWMLNRVPLVLTLRPLRGYTIAQIEDGKVVEWHYQNMPQHNVLVRLLYFLLIGWWFSLIWSLVAWLACVSIIGLPLGTWMFNRLPNVTTLMRQ